MQAVSGSRRSGWGGFWGALRGSGGVLEVVGPSGVEPWGAIRGVHAGDYLEYLPDDSWAVDRRNLAGCWM